MTHRSAALRLNAALLLGTLAVGGLGALASGPAHADGPPAPVTTIAALDVPRYLGTWYEIARLPNRFQRHCVSDTRAEYSLDPGPGLKVVNRCRTENGTVSEAVAAARQIGGPTSPRLQVRFAPAWLSFLPAVWGDYWVLDLDADYQWVAVGEPSRQYLWVLARSPRLDPAVYAALLERLARQGFDVRQLELTRHSGPAPATAP